MTIGIRRSPAVLSRAAAVLTLPSLALMAWSILSPRPGPIVLAMTLGQVLGTVALSLYLVAVALDLRRSGALASRVSSSQATARRETGG